MVRPLRHTRSCILAALLAAGSVWSSGASAQESEASRNELGYFLQLGVRTKVALDHAYPLLSGAGGVRFGGLRVGISFAISSASLDSYRLTRVLPEGMTYRGQSQLELGFVDTHIGVYASWVIDPFDDGRVLFEIPVSVGMSGIGTPLMGEDRDTPDGDRVSTWEQMLTDGNDFLVGVGFELGVITRFRLVDEVPGFQLGAGVHYSFSTVAPEHVERGNVHGPLVSLHLVFED